MRPLWAPDGRPLLHLKVRCSDGVQGGVQSGDRGSDPALAGGKQPAEHSGGDGAVPGNGAEVPGCCPGSRGGPGGASPHRRPVECVGVGQPLGSAGAGGAHRGKAGPVGGPDLPVDYPGQAAVHPYPGVAGGSRLPDLLFVPAPVAEPAPLAAT